MMKEGGRKRVRERSRESERNYLPRNFIPAREAAACDFGVPFPFPRCEVCKSTRPRNLEPKHLHPNLPQSLKIKEIFVFSGISKLGR